MANKLFKDLKNGNIDPNSSPKDVWNSNELYRGYELTIFRANFNIKLLKPALRVCRRGSEEGLTFYPPV